jgi:hypothetical protein
LVRIESGTVLIIPCFTGLDVVLCNLCGRNVTVIEEGDRVLRVPQIDRFRTRI